MDLARHDTASTASASEVYVGHLVEMEASHGVVTAEDIFNDRGVLLLRKGTALRPEMALRLRGHTLQKPPDELLSVGKTLTAKELCDDCVEHIERFDDLALLHRQTGFDEGLHHLFFLRALPRIIL